MVPEREVDECCERLSEVLAFLRTEFLRVLTKHGLCREDLITALAGLGVSAIDSLSAAILTLYRYDLSSSGVMVRRFDEHFALMFYFALCDTGETLSRWFKNPGMVLTERNHKIRTAVDAKMANFFERNPDWSFRERFRAESAENVHATWASVQHSICWAVGRYGLATPEDRGWSSLADELRRGRAVLVLGTMAPATSRFIEFLQKIVFTRPEFAEASPGDAYISTLDDDIVRWWGIAGGILDETEARQREISEGRPARQCEQNPKDVHPSNPRARPDEKDSPAFESELERLDWLIQQVEERVTHQDLPSVDAELLILFTVTGAWFNTALTRTKAILMLLEQGLQEAVGPLERALWELWTDWHYLLNQGDRNLNASKVRLNAMVEALDSFEKHQDTLPPSMLAQMKRDVQEFEAQYPNVSAEVRAQRKKRNFHWSGMSRSEMERALSGSAFAYQFLSWDAHGVMSPIRDVSWEFNDEVAHFRFGRQENESDIRRHAWMSGGVLYYIYNDFAQMWGLPPVVLPGAKGNEASG